MSALPLRKEDARQRQPSRRDRLDEVARRVREDARRAPERTLEDAEVPAGGE